MITESLHGIILLVAYTADMSIYPTGNLYWGKTPHNNKDENVH